MLFQKEMVTILVGFRDVYSFVNSTAHLLPKTHLNNWYLDLEESLKKIRKQVSYYVNWVQHIGS